MTLVHRRRLSARRRIPTVLVALLALGALAASSSSAESPSKHAAKPTIVLVHGAWTDASGWDGVIRRLQSDGYRVVAPATPLRSLIGDSAYIASVVHSISGPIVLVGHSYGGAVITNAAYGNPNVRALVYIDAFVPAQGESILQLAGMNPGSELPTAITELPYSQGASLTGLDVYLKTASFGSVFAADVSQRQANLMAVTQRPVAMAALTEPSGPPAWKQVPSWYLIGQEDKAIPPITQKFMASRAASHTVKIDSSHASPVSHPGAVTHVILAAARATR